MCRRYNSDYISHLDFLHSEEDKENYNHCKSSDSLVIAHEEWLILNKLWLVEHVLPRLSPFELKKIVKPWKYYDEALERLKERAGKTDKEEIEWKSEGRAKKYWVKWRDLALVINCSSWSENQYQLGTHLTLEPHIIGIKTKSITMAHKLIDMFF